MSDKTLIIGPSWIGDMVMAQALLKVIKSDLPNTSIEVLAPEWCRPLTERMPEVAASIAMPVNHGQLALKTRYRLGRKLKEQRYQRCYVLPNSFKSALIPFFANIPHRIGWRGEWRYGLLNHCHVLDKKIYPFMVSRYMALAKQCDPDAIRHFRPALCVTQTNMDSALERYGLSLSRPVMVLCPGAEFGPSKRWPSSYYAQLANHYLDRDWQLWIMGSAKDAMVALEIQAQTQSRCIDFTGKTSLGDAIDLMSQAKMVLSNDSGLMHIAAALSRPMIALYGSSSADFTPPLFDKAKVIRANLSCSPCFKRNCPLGHHLCMKQITVPMVIDAIEKMVIL